MDFSQRTFRFAEAAGIGRSYHGRAQMHFYVAYMTHRCACRACSLGLLPAVRPLNGYSRGLHSYEISRNHICSRRIVRQDGQQIDLTNIKNYPDKWIELRPVYSMRRRVHRKEIKATGRPHRDSTKRERQEMDPRLKTAGPNLFWTIRSMRPVHLIND